MTFSSLQKMGLIGASILFIFSIARSSAQTFITHVTVADVEKQKLIPDQTVVITNDIISDIKSGNTKIPSGATVIDGKGKYLLPGLTDAHVHFFQNGGLYTRPDAIDLRKFRPFEKEMAYSHEQMENVLRRYLQNGITNVIDVGATYNFLRQRDTFRDKSFSPTIFMTGPLLTTYEPSVYENLKDDAPFNLVKTPEDGIRMVQNQLAFKPDFIKIWYIVGRDADGEEAGARKNLPLIKAIIDEAHKNNLKVAVHATERITAQLAVENGCDFLVHSVEDELIKDDFVELLKTKKVFLCPTLTVFDGYMNTFGQNHKFSKHEMNTADAYQLGTLLDLKHLSDTAKVNQYKTRANSEKGMQGLKDSDRIMMENLKKLSDAGVLIATGTDAGNIGTLHVSSYLTEVLLMSKSGMSNWKIIEASTINGAKVLGKEKDFGSIDKGKKANLILLDENPVDDIENLTKINKVINNGVVLSPSDILHDSPTDVVQRQLNAYNLRDINAFMDTYAEDVELYDHPEKLLGKGKEKMRTIYAGMFEKTPDLHCEVLNRIVQGNVIIDKESVRAGGKVFEAVAVYHVENGKIKKVYFIE